MRKAWKYAAIATIIVACLTPWTVTTASSETGQILVAGRVTSGGEPAKGADILVELPEADPTWGYEPGTVVPTKFLKATATPTAPTPYACRRTRPARFSTTGC